VFITAVPIIKLFAWGEGDSGGHVLRKTTSRGLCGLVCPSHTSEILNTTVWLQRVRLCSSATGRMQGTGIIGSLGNRTQNSMVAGARTNHQPIRGSDPNHQRIWSPPRVGLVKFCSAMGSWIFSCQAVAASSRRGRGMGGQNGLGANVDVW
jgi:hypothetical protein